MSGFSDTIEAAVPYAAPMTVRPRFHANDHSRDVLTIEPLVAWDARAVYFGLPFRRRLAEPWFRPIARIGSRGNDEYVLPGPVSQIRARTSGELFLFVNDAVIEVPGLRGLFYRNNAGTARVTVEQFGRGPQ